MYIKIISLVGGLQNYDSSCLSGQWCLGQARRFQLPFWAVVSWAGDEV